MNLLNNDDILSAAKSGKKKISVTEKTVVTPLAKESAEKYGVDIVEDIMRKPFIAGNWKMNKTNQEAVAMVNELKNLVTGVDDVDIMVAPPFTALTVLNEVVKGSNISLGSQNMHFEQSGAYTGEISSSMLLEAGCEWVIIGHSERRQFFGCTDELVNKKLKAAAEAGLKPIVCVGETLSERENGETFDVLKTQIEGGLDTLSDTDKANLVIAYEPVWAIGTGKTATPEQAEEVHKFIRDLIAEMYGAEYAASIRILYGGSIKPSNITEIMQKENVDGGLVGGASLEAESFSQVVRF